MASARRARTPAFRDTRGALIPMSLNAGSIGDLLDLMRRLRNPGGCAWDREQTFATIAPYTIEEAYEVADAIERGDMADLKDELGDLLFQVVFHARMAEEAGVFNFDDVVRAVTGKMVRRHPHVFAGQAERTAHEQTRAWEATKAVERAGKRGEDASILDGVAMALPALTRAVKLSRRAARVGFVWPDVDAILFKLEEEIAELRVELAAGDRDSARAELGDVLFVCANIARELDVDPEEVLRAANAKFTRRFEFIEERLRAEGRAPAKSSLEEMEKLWLAAKRSEAPPAG